MLSERSKSNEEQPERRRKKKQWSETYRERERRKDVKEVATLRGRRQKNTGLKRD